MHQSPQPCALAWQTRAMPSGRPAKLCTPVRNRLVLGDISPCDVSARAVRVVATGQGTADIHDYWISSIDDAVREAVVWIGAIFHGAHDDKVHVDVLLKNHCGEIVGYFTLGASWLQQFRYLCVHAVDCLRGLAQFVDFCWVFRRKQLRSEERRGGKELRS